MSAKKPAGILAQGKITSWYADKGFGFITPLAGGKPVFVHINAFRSRHRPPALNQRVSYALSRDKQGRPCAAKVTRAGDRPPRDKTNRGLRALIGAAFFLGIVGGAVITKKIPLLILAVYIVASLGTFLLYAWDKSAARRGSWRTRERTLHLLSLAGGWPGALVAQQALRHKSKKQAFRLWFWVTVCLNGGAFAWLLTPEGAAMLRSLAEAMV